MAEIIQIKTEGIDSHFGSITDGNLKIEFNLYNMKQLSQIEIGTKIQLCGDLEKTSLFIR